MGASVNGMRWGVPDGPGDDFESRVARAALRSKKPRKTIVDKLLFAHGWKRNCWRGGGWIPPGEKSTFGCPVTVESLRQRGYGALASQLLGIENMLMNWIEADCEQKRSWYQGIIGRAKGE